MYVLTEACCVCRGLFIHSNVVFFSRLQSFGKQTAEANTPFTNKYDTCLWTRLSGNTCTCRSGSQAFHPLQYRKPRVDCVDLLKDAIPLSTDSSQDITLSPFPFPLRPSIGRDVLLCGVSAYGNSLLSVLKYICGYH